MTKVAILEDEVIICEILQKQLAELGYEVVGYALDYKEAVDLLKEKNPDIFLLDINLRGAYSGRDFAAYLRANADIPLIFVTSYSEREVIDSVKEFFPDGYLLKPFVKEDLFAAIEMAIHKFNHKPRENGKVATFFFLKQDAFFVKIDFDELHYIKSDGGYLELFTENRKYVYRQTLKNVLETLPEHFMQIHRSYAINVKSVEAVSKESVMIAGQSLPVSTVFSAELFQRLNIKK